jgi:membrane protease YdiL (CAAX protease family)
MKKSRTNSFEQFLLVYSVISFIGIYVCHFIHNNLGTLGYANIAWPTEHIAFAMLSSFIIIAGSSLICELSFSSYIKRKNEIFAPFKQFNFWQIFVVALFASFAEEIFFRAALQTSLGIILTSIITSLPYLLGFLTCPSLFFLALIQNIIFGVLYHYTQSILLGASVHFLLTSISFYRQQYIFKTKEAK